MGCLTLDYGMAKQSGIYAIRNTTTGDYYIGSSVNVNARMRNHAWELRRGTHPNARLQRAWQKYGPGAFSFECIALIPQQDIRSAEQRLLDRLARRHDCYNMALATDSVMRGRSHSPETREKLRRAMLSRPPVPRTPEWSRRIGEASKGRTLSESARAKLRAFHTGRRASPEARAKLSAAGMGRVPSKETRTKLSAAARAREDARRVTHCKRGHAFDAANTHIDKRGCRICRACGRGKRRRQEMVAAGGA